jgi:O-glycosyl hydrolase
MTADNTPKKKKAYDLIFFNQKTSETYPVQYRSSRMSQIKIYKWAKEYLVGGGGGKEK